MQWIFGVVIPFSMALINVPFFPRTINIIAFGICLGIGIAGIISNLAVIL